VRIWKCFFKAGILDASGDPLKVSRGLLAFMMVDLV
jgi:hypothetical protein